MRWPFTRAQSKEDYWNSKYPKATIIYEARSIPNVGTYPLDVRAFFVNPRCEELQKIVRHWRNDKQDKQALAAQLWVAFNIKYISDKEEFGLEEFWSYPSELLKTGKGDCDDGAILIANLMIACGIPYWKVRLTAGMTPFGAHAYVTYFCDELDHWVAMDWCYKPDFSLISDRPDYKDSPIYGEVWFSWNRRYAFSKGVKEENEQAIKACVEKI